MREWVKIAAGWGVVALVGYGVYWAMNPGPTDWEPEPRYVGPAAAYMEAGEDGWLYAIYTDGTVRGIYEGVEKLLLQARAYEMHKAAGGVIISHEGGGTFLINGTMRTLNLPGHVASVMSTNGGAYLQVLSSELRSIDIWYFDGRSITRVEKVTSPRTLESE